MRAAQISTRFDLLSAKIDSNTLTWLFVALTGYVLIPIAFVDVPPLVDLPNHLARIHILSNITRDELLAANYSTNWTFGTYLLPDLVLLAAAQIMSIYAVGKLYAAGVIAALAASTFWLSHVIHKRPNALAFLSLLFVYNLPFAWGFLNFLLGLSLALLTFGLWLRYHGSPVGRQIVWVMLLVLVTYFVHSLALVVSALLMGGYQIWSLWRPRRRHGSDRIRPLLAVMAPFLVPVILFLATGMGDTLASGATIYGSWGGKLRALLSPSRMYGQPIDFYIWVSIFTMFAIGLSTRKLRLTAAVQWPLILLVVAAVAIPERLLGVWGTDFRLPTAICLVTCAGLSVRNLTLVARWSIGIVFFAFLSARVVMLHNVWGLHDDRFGEFRAALSHMERGARVLVVEAEPTPIYWHLAALSVIERSAFVPTIFTGVATLRPSTETAELDTPSGHPLRPAELISETYEREALDSFHRIYWKDWRRNFDYVIWFGDSPETETLFRNSDLVVSGSFYDIYRALPTAALR